MESVSYTKTMAEQHDFKAGDRVIVLTIERKDGTIQRSLFLYLTGASHVEGGLQRDGIKYTVSREPWSGSEPVCFDNGD